MSPVMLVFAFVGIFVAVFGLMFVALRFANRSQGQLGADGEPAQQVVPRTPKMEKLAERLRYAGIDLEPERYHRRVLRGTILVMLIGMIMGGFGAGGVIFALILGFTAYKGGDYFITYKYQQRMTDFGDQFSDALGVMANGAKSGQTVMQTLETVSGDFSDPLKAEIDDVLSELRMGVALDEALDHWVTRMPGEDLEIACTALTVQRQTGGNVAEILETVALTIRDRNKLHKQIRALTATGRMSGWVMGLLPVGMFLAMYFIAPARTGLLITNPFGLVLTGIGVGAILTGGYFIKRIVTIEV